MLTRVQNLNTDSSDLAAMFSRSRAGSFSGRLLLLLVTFLLLTGAWGAPVLAEDWPQWQGPRRDSVWQETGLLTKFPASGPKVLWKAPLNVGYAGPAVSQGRVVVLDFANEEPDIVGLGFQQKKIPGQERVVCLDAKTGDKLWHHAYETTYNIQYPSGPRCTPTIHDGLVYALGAMGDLTCLRLADGQVVWSKNFVKDFGSEVPVWGYAGHPLVHGDLLIVSPGGEGNSTVAFDRKTGAVRWKALTAKDPGYSPPTVIKHNGQEQLLIWNTDGLFSLNPLTGAEYWSLPIKVDYNMPVMTPRLAGDNLFVSGVEATSAWIALGKAESGGGKSPTAEIAWRGTPKNSLATVNSAPFVQGDYVYGSHVSGPFRCVKLADGAVQWEAFEPTVGKDLGGQKSRSGTAFVVKNGERFLIFSETGDLIIAQLLPEKYTEISRAKIIEPTGTAWGRALVWSHPAFANKCVFARNDKEIVCVSLAE
ncbi:MAG: PQQ-binding-like beta-propeller repeat protein [Pirellulales bacterium]|nr:PQQ-binding-like beta-propeller repeat protein [Pirellulales bacterium]